MKKHDFLSALFFLLAIGGAALVYYNFNLAGQIVYTLSMVAASFMTKLKAYPLQAWLALFIAAGFGYVIGDWWISAATVCGYLALTFRTFALSDKIYSSVNWQEPVLAVIGVGIYATANIIHDNGWQGWAFPAPTILLGCLSFQGFADRNHVRKMISNNLIEVGSPAPDFALTNFDGKSISLSDYKGIRDMLLIFVRGDWCPSCHIMLRMYERERKKFQDKNVMLFAIGPDPVGVNRAMVEKLGIEFAVLSDETMEITRKYCLEVQKGVGGFEHGAPLPASFLVDKQGVIRYTSRSNNAGEFLRPDLIFDVLAKI